MLVLPVLQTSGEGMAIDWYAENLRLTFFGVTNWTQRQIFSEISGFAPAQINAQPPLQIHQELGDVADSYLTVAQQAGRIDVILSDQPTRNTTDSDAPNYRPLFWVGPWKDSIQTFEPITSKVISLIPGATRLAYAITLVHRTKDARESMECLHEYLPTVKFAPAHDTDIVFQLNRPVRSASGMRINRVSRWESLRMATMQINVGLPLSTPLTPKPPTFAARAYIEINTDENATAVIDKSGMTELVDMLRSYAVSIAQNGDST